MNCTQTRTYIECYIDGELDPITSVGVEEHLHHCAACHRALGQLNSLRSLIKEGAPYHSAPDRLSSEIRARLNQGRIAATRRTDAPWRQWLRPAALVAATAVVTWVVALQVENPSRNELLAGEIITSHSRSTLTGHITDVASSDRHTVKPWLRSKLDFSPPVVDLTAAGFPLLGGRLDYLDNRPVSVLVYRRRQHVIDLFIWPTSEPHTVALSRALSKRGYQMLYWAAGGMTFWAISDLNAGEMKSFADNFSTAK